MTSSVCLSDETCTNRVAAFTSEKGPRCTLCRIRHGCIARRQFSTCSRLHRFRVEYSLLAADVQKSYFCCAADADIDCVLDVLLIFSCWTVMQCTAVYIQVSVCGRWPLVWKNWKCRREFDSCLTNVGKLLKSWEVSGEILVKETCLGLCQCVVVPCMHVYYAV